VQPDSPAEADRFDRRYIGFLCWGPFLLALALEAASGLRFKDMWGTPFWDFLGLFIVLFLVPGPRRLGRGFVALWLTIFGGTLLAYGIQFPGQALTGAKPLRGQFAGRLLAQRLDAGWHRAEGTRPLRFVIGDEWLAGNVAFALWAERPSVMIDGDAGKSPWVDAGRLACAGGVLVWNEERPGYRHGILRRFPEAQAQPTFDLPWQTRAKRPEIIGWAILPPRGGC
jgi:hypothetical protein